MSVLGTILSLLTGVAGWFYMFYSKAAARLGGLEAERLNRRRVALRRVGGGVMLGLAVLMYLGFNAVHPDLRPRAFILVWMSAIALLGALVVLALIDVRLTVHLRRQRRLDTGTTLEEHDPS